MENTQDSDIIYLIIWDMKGNGNLCWCKNVFACTITFHIWVLNFSDILSILQQLEKMRYCAAEVSLEISIMADFTVC